MQESALASESGRDHQNQWYYLSFFSSSRLIPIQGLRQWRRPPPCSSDAALGVLSGHPSKTARAHQRHIIENRLWWRDA